MVHLAATRGKYGATHYEDHSSFVVINVDEPNGKQVHFDLANDRDLADLIYVLTQSKYYMEYSGINAALAQYDKVHNSGLGTNTTEDMLANALKDLLGVDQPNPQPALEYGFSADGGPVITATYGGLVTFNSYESAKHTGDKCYNHTLRIVQRIKGSNDEWVTAQAPS